jgi:hypothetical protein
VTFLHFARLLLLLLLLVSSLAYSSTLEKEAICTSETSADFHQTMPCYFPEDGDLTMISLIEKRYLKHFRGCITP